MNTKTDAVGGKKVNWRKQLAEDNDLSPSGAVAFLRALGFNTATRNGLLKLKGVPHRRDYFDRSYFPSELVVWVNDVMQNAGL